ncbi:zinc-dependent alcohol dehydrogenase [Hyalangium rubrum]|uniref:Alcohol dehydrogenase catalytic domain-containing protein n=1 Tax=Hyalangium rubrum TaxID=3103134 RepID=A0ABU5H911_9BACT|nr:alcohol dehydrogenase catalytic domain-containing protein [Hyalangium sp. s54d21]MDY7229726.1 alcohol dehydrogenase catalytic domain-containing protein [Hyalangium sp. s54d21]
MKGLVFDLSIPKYVLAKGIGGMYPKVHYGPGSCLSLRKLPSPTPPGPEWVRLRPLLTGLCGSDMATVFFKASPQLEPFNSFPAVLGHEILAEVTALGPETRGVEVGQRVAVNPLLPCRLRGIHPPCKPCAAGLENGCERTADGCLAAGQMLGYQKDLPGGMGTEMVAHPSQLHLVPASVSNKAGVLVEPLAVSLHAVLKAGLKDEDRVLVIGGGPVAFAALWAIRALGHRSHVTLLATEEYQLKLARLLGADEAFRVQGDVAEAQEVARRTGARVYQPVIGPPALTGGFEVTIDCIGSAASVQDSLRYTRALGRVVLVGAAGILERVDWTTVWRNELTLLGSYVYGPESFRGGRKHTFDLVLELLARREGPDPSVLVTHTFPLSRYREAIEANLARGRYQSVKTAFDLTVNA